MNSITPLKPRPAPGEQGSTPFRSSTNRFRSSLVPMNKPSPARTARLTGKLATNPSYGRDLFRTSTPQTTRTTKFAPALPADATRTTPTARKFAQKTSQGGMSGIASAELFKMRIPSPDPELSGEALAKEVPNDPNRTGTIYADQFLAHKCPPHFDDLQRRQFFCILDLRRLKYAADEIFVKKDWKLNIMNFAKEYEKSRGLIMLRYGLYEFKNVKPSEEVLKRWRATHNLPDPDPEPESGSTTASRTPVQNNRRTGVPGTSTKRKAEEELAPKDNALMASTANQNKRRNVAQEQVDYTLTGPAPFKKSKRKADETDEPDENQPNKVQKPTPSAAKSKFESILNKAQSGNTSPLKRPPLASFGAQKPSESQNSGLTSKSNPFAASTNGFKSATVETVKEDSSAGSVLAGHKVGSMPTKAGNIFSYLSESSANSSGNENGNADEGETESESEEGDSQEARASEQPSAAGSVGTNTPPTQIDGTLFSSNKPSTQNLFGQANKDLSGQAQASKGGLFGRVQMGSNGQPLRATTDVEEHPIFGSTKPPAAEKEPIKTPAKKPGDYTFNAATTPISFGPPASHVANTPATSSRAESGKEPAKSEDTAAPKATPALFGAGAPVNPAFQPTTASLFGTPNGTSNASQTKLNTTLASSIFGQNSAPTPSNLFSPAATKLFGGVEKASEGDSSAFNGQQMGASNVGQESADSTQAETKATTPAPKEPTSLFGASTATPVATAQSKSLFGNSVSAADSKPAESVGNQSLFGDNAGKSSTSSLFGASPSTTTSFNADNAKVNGFGPAKSVFDTPGKQPAASFTFGATKPETVSDTNKPGNASTPKPIFGSEEFKPTSTSGPSLFGNNSTTSSSIFGAKSSEAKPVEKPSTPATPPLFGNNSSSSTSIFNSKGGSVAVAEKKDEPVAAKPSSIFGSTPSSAAPGFVFGAQPTTPATNNTQSSSTPAMIFGASTNATQTNGGEPKKPEIQFGSSTAGASTTPFAFSQGSSGPSFTFTPKGSGQSFNNPFASSSAQSPAPMFGNGPSTPAPASTSSSLFSFGQQAPSTPNPAPVSQGNNLFGASSNAGNGAPSFSFTGATPLQNNSNMFAPKPLPGSSGSFLQASNDIPAGASSPFPAPSSLGTTPISGTPEPQSQGEDGEEGAQVQISLTATSEEDETVLHEVRAKAIKYIPIIKGSDDEEERKSPWSTQGVGTLRVLKHDHTGIVRVLLRAEPRGHVAMNKALLSDIEYKAKDKTVNFVAANDDGSGLETWVLQVKKPDMAQQLAGVLEQHKSANKK